MNRRVLTGIYLSVWLAVLAGVVLIATRSGLPIYWALVIAWLLFWFVNGTLAYIFRSRQLRREGKQPPNYLLYLVRPKPLSSAVSIPRPVRMMLGLIILAGGAVCLVIGISHLPNIIVGVPPAGAAMAPSEIGAVAFSIVVGLACLYVGSRLVQLRTNTEHLLPHSDDNRAG